jgi:hypothetical protein
MSAFFQKFIVIEPLIRLSQPLELTFDEGPSLKAGRRFLYCSQGGIHGKY